MSNSRTSMPQTVEAYKKLATRDLELIEEQREEISKLKMKVNKLKQKCEKLNVLMVQVQQDLWIRSDDNDVVNLSNHLWRQLKQLTKRDCES